MPDTQPSPDLETPYDLDPATADRFRADGFAHLPGVFSADTLAHYGREIDRLTMAHAPDVPLEERDTYGKAFIQVGNLWRKSDVAKEFSFSRRLARLAAELLGVEGVRMWHDQALFKEPAGGFTPWHADQQYWPMSSARCVTAWIPLQATPLEMGPLCFGRGSHRKNIGRDLEISDTSEKMIAEAVEREGIDEVQAPYDAGDVSFHLGWTLHRAGPNTTDQPRRVHTVIYMDRDMTLAEPRNQRQRNDWETWTPSTNVGEVMDDPLNPVLWERSA
ncbi:MAG: phytanoyl-CoA dioxygenase family protein [Phycisphaeraceae bacterium]|nr:phytanoyl-CoA dioxygenase family protein [Phycisphaeraceae bacterium]